MPKRASPWLRQFKHEGLGWTWGFKTWLLKKRHIAIVTALSLILLIAVSTVISNSGIIAVHASPYNGITHTRATIYQTPSSFGQAAQDWNFNQTKTVGYPNGLCVGIQSTTQIRMQYTTGTTSQNLGYSSGAKTYGAKFAPTDTGNAIDVPSQNRMWYAQGRWWVFYTNTTGANANKITYQSSLTGSNVTGSWTAPQVTTFFGSAIDYAAWANNTNVILEFTTSSAFGNAVDIAVGTFNGGPGTITFGAATQVFAPISNANFIVNYLWPVDYFGDSSNKFTGFFTIEANSKSVGTGLGTSKNSTVVFSTNAGYTTFSSITTLRIATGVNATLINDGVHFSQFQTQVDTTGLNGNVWVSSGTSTQQGLLGVVLQEWFSNSTSFGSLFHYVPDSGLFPGFSSPNFLTLASLYNLYPGVVYAWLVEGEQAETTQSYAGAIWTVAGGWGAPLVTNQVRVNPQDISAILAWDSHNRQMALVSQTAGALGINAAFSNNNGTSWTQTRQTIFFTLSPNFGNVSNVFMRNAGTKYSYIVTDGTDRMGNFWTEPVLPFQGTTSTGNYNLMFGSMLFPSGLTQPGNNCGSADVAILKSPFNLQTVSSSQLEIFWEFDCQGDGAKVSCLGFLPDLASIEIGLRTNSTLPGFAENWIPDNDPTVRFIYRMVQQSGGAIQTNVLIAHSPGQSIAQEGIADVFFSPSTLSLNAVCTAGNLNTYNQLVINYTGTSSSVSSQITNPNGTNCKGILDQPTTTAPQLQQGQEYYLYVKATWGPTLGPAANEVIDFVTAGVDPTGAFPGATSSSFYAVPSCGNDPGSNCVTINAANQHQYSLFDPSTWGNAIVDGLGWVGNQAGGLFASAGNALAGFGNNLVGVFASGLSAFGSVAIPVLGNVLSVAEGFIQNILNIAGAAFGFPQLGTNLFSFISAVILLFTVQVPNAFLQIGPIFNGWINSLTIIFTTGIIGQIFGFLSAVMTFGINGIGFAFTLFTTGLQWTTIGLPFWAFVWFFGFNADDGMDGWLKWFNVMKWVAFDLGVKNITWLLNWTIDIITAVISIVPKPFIQMASSRFPRIPVLDIHGSFSIPDFHGSALREGNLFSVLGMLGGFIGFVWYELSQTTIPGTLANQYPNSGFVTGATNAITFYKLFLPMAVLVVFLLMVPTLFHSIFGVRVIEGGLPLPTLGHRARVPVTVRGSSGMRLLTSGPRHLEKFRQSRLAETRKAVEDKKLRNQREQEKKEQDKRDQEFEQERTDRRQQEQEQEESLLRATE